MLNHVHFVFLGPPGSPGEGIPGSAGERGEPGRPGKIHMYILCNFDKTNTNYLQFTVSA